MTRKNVTTSEAAFICGVDARSFARWARRHDIEPVERMRVGRSTVTLWAVSSLLSACQLDSPTPAC